MKFNITSKSINIEKKQEAIQGRILKKCGTLDWPLKDYFQGQNNQNLGFVYN